MPVIGGAGTSSFMKDTDGVGISQRTTTQINNMTGMVAGQIAYDTDINVLKYYDGSSWYKISSAIPTLSSVSGILYAGVASTLTLAGTNFLTANLVVNFLQSSDGVNVNVTVTPSSDTAATVAVPSSVYSNVTGGNAVTIKVTNSDSVASNTQNITVQGLPTGGNITGSGTIRIHTFTSSGNFVIPSGFSKTGEVLSVAGGGGGGSGCNGPSWCDGGGGGGAGGLVYSNSVSLTAGTKSIVVGAGGAGGSGNSGGQNRGVNGSNSTTGSLVSNSIGGGGGGYGSRASDGLSSGNAGGSGGGTNNYNNSGSNQPGAGTSGQGNRGGISSGNSQSGTGGGGAGAVGDPISTSSSNSVGGSGGGDGVAKSTSGSSITYAGGGGGGSAAQICNDQVS